MRLEDLKTAPRPRIDETAWVAPTASVVGDVSLGAHASVWYGCVLRGDVASIAVGPESCLQDLSVVHVDEGVSCGIGARVGIGHRAIVHGAEIGDECLIGMGAIVLSRSCIGRGSVIAAGALVTEGTVVPAGSLVIGIPGRVVRSVDDALRERARLTVEHYRLLKEGHRTGRWAPP